MAEVKKLVDAKIAGKKVMVFSKKTCGFCRMAKEALSHYNLTDDEYEVMEIDSSRDCGAIQDYLLKLTGARSVPRVFIKGRCIGGGSETSDLHRSGKLQALL